MKRILLAIVALWTLPSCMMVEDEPVCKAEAFRIEAGFAGTKTVLNTADNSVTWAADDALAVLIDDGTSKNFHQFVKVADEPNAFECTDFAPEAGKTYTYSVVYPYKSTYALENIGDDGYMKGMAYLELPTTASSSLKQTAIDDAAHVCGALYGQGTAEGKGSPNISMSHYSHVFRAKVMNNTSGAITVTEVSMTSDASLILSGTYFVNFSTGDLKASEAKYVSESVRVGVTNGEIAAGESGIVYIVTPEFTVPAGNNLTFTVKCEEGSAEVVKTMSSDLVCAAGGIRTASLEVSASNFVEKPEVEPLSGNYVVVAANGKGDYYAMSSDPDGSRLAYVTLEGFDPAAEVFETENSKLKWTIAASGDKYTFRNVGNSNYLSYTSGNSAGTSETEYGFTISQADGGMYHISTVDSESVERILAKNTNADYGFAFYKSSGYKDLYLIPTEPVEETVPKYVKVTEDQLDWSGQYLIVYEAERFAFDGSLETLDASSNTKSVTIANGMIDATPEMDAISFTIASMGGGYSIQAANGKYIGNANDSNGLTSSESALANTISIADGALNVISSGGAYLRYNATAEQDRFRYYKSATYTSQKPVALYKRGLVAGGGSGNGGSGSDDDQGPSGSASCGWLELPAQGNLQNADEYVIRASDDRRNYTVYYDTDTYSSLWVAYPLAPGHMGSIARPSPDPWAAYSGISSDWQINIWSGGYGVSYPTTNYNSNSYARGHQIANADRNGIEEMQIQTFLAINSTPQIQNGFNGGIWVNLENALQTHAKTLDAADSLYIATGPVYKTVGGSEVITYLDPAKDTKDCPIPNYYYKVVLKVKRSGKAVTSAMAVGFWFEHREYALKTDNYVNCAVSVNEIENKTGFDFFANLPDGIEVTAESNASWETFCSF